MSPVQTTNIRNPISVVPHQARSLWPMAVGLAVIIIGSGWWFLLRPQWQAYQALPKVEGFEASRQAVINELTSLSKVNDEFNRLAATDRKRLELALPQGQDLPNLLAQFEGIAKATNFSITNIGFSSPESEQIESPLLADQSGQMAPAVAPGPQVKKLKVSVNIKGGEYKNLKEFIAAAEQSIRLLKLSSVSFAGDSSTPDGVSYALNFTTTYLSK